MMSSNKAAAAAGKGQVVHTYSFYIDQNRKVTPGKLTSAYQPGNMKEMDRALKSGM